MNRSPASALTFWDETVLKHQFARIASPHTQLVQLLVGREPFPPLLDDKRRDPLRALLRGRLRINDKRRRHRPVRDPELVPSKPIPALDLTRAERHAHDVAPAPRLAHREAADFAPGDEVGQVLVLLGVCAPPVDLVHA